jgi:hypothetical protein
VIKAGALVPTSVRRPPLVWGKSSLYGDTLALNGAEVDLADYPDLFSLFGYLCRGAGPKFYLSDGFPVDEQPYQKEFEWFVSPRMRAAGWARS